MRLMDIAAENINVQELRQKLARECAHKLKNASNWILTNAGLICCHSGKRIYLTDDNFIPLLAFESTANIAASGVSPEGNYIVCQMSFNSFNDKDNGATALIDVQQRRVIKQKQIAVGGLDTRTIFIDEQKKAIYIYVADKLLGEGNNFKVKYDFELLPDVKSLRAYYQKPDISPYILNGRAQRLITRIQTDGLQTDIEKEILKLLERMKSSDMSIYQLASTYKMLGDLYLELSLDEKALAMYETGLSVNPNLAVKKTIKMLQKRLL